MPGVASTRRGNELVSSHRHYKDPVYRANRAVILAAVIHGTTACAICGERLELGQRLDCHHIDSVAARRERGLAPDHDIGNLAPTHAVCNRGGKPPRRPPVSRADIYPDR